MATITATVAVFNPPGGGMNAMAITWGPMANGDVGAAVGAGLNLDTNNYTDVSLQVTGTFGAGGSVAMEGSNDGTNFVALRDPQGVTIAITAAGIKAVLEAVREYRPHVTAGDGTTALTVTAYFRRTI
jgi:hypothetical protein